MDDILSVIRDSLAHSPPTTDPILDLKPEPQPVQIFVEEEQRWDDDDEVGDVEQALDPNEILFDDTGEGAGVEGDLDVEDD